MLEGRGDQNKNTYNVIAFWGSFMCSIELRNAQKQNDFESHNSQTPTGWAKCQELNKAAIRSDYACKRVTGQSFVMAKAPKCHRHE